MKVVQVKKTINYAAFFNAQLTLKDLHLWLISPQKHSIKELTVFLRQHPQLQKKIIAKNNQTRQKKTRLTKKKIKNIQKLIFTLRLIPAIKLIALTGSLSVNNPKKNDDIDLMIIVAPNTLWLTRPLVILASSLLSKRRKPGVSVISNQVCINLWLDQTSLAVPKNKRNLYTAHEVLQIRPLFDREGVYHQFISANSWVKKYLANAYAAILAQDGSEPPAEGFSSDGSAAWVTAFLRGLLRGGTHPLNLLAFKLQYLYMKKKITNEYVTLHAAYFHPRNLYPKIKTKLHL